MTLSGTDAAAPTGDAPETNSVPATTDTAIDAAPAAVEKHRLKIDDEEVEYTLDELKRYAQKERASDKRFREAAELKKQGAAEIAEARALREAIKSGQFDALLADTPPEKIKEFSENFLLKVIEYEKMSPSEREAFELRQRVAAYENDKQKREADAKVGETKALEAKVLAQLDTDLSEAIKATGITKPTPRLIARIAEQMLANLDTEEAQLPASEAVQFAVRDIHHDIAEYLSLLPVSEARKLLPKEFLEALRKADVEEHMAQDPLRSSQRAPRTEAPRTPAKGQRMKTDDFFKQLEANIGG